MLQTPVNYYGTPVQSQPSYNAVKIDIHNPKVMDGQPCYPQPYPSAYGMPVNPYYNYPQATAPVYYPQVPQAQPNGYIPQTVPYYQPPQQLVQQPVQQPVPQQAPQVVTYPQPPVTVNPPVQTQPQPAVIDNAGQAPQAAPVVPAPVPVVPAPVQQVINNGVPTTQTIVQNPTPAPVQTVQPQTVTTQEVPAQTTQPTETTQPAQATQTTQMDNAQINPPAKTLGQNDVALVLKGLQSNNLAEQSEALNKIGDAADSNDPKEIQKYLDTNVLDSLLGVLNTDTSGLAPATQEQIDARTKWINEKDLPDNEKTMTQKEIEAAMTLAPQEVADSNKQHALYSISILQKALANAVEEKTGEKLGIEKLPAIDQVVNVVKSNPNPLLRASALVALAHLDKPEYKPVLTDIFTIAQKDVDPNVQKVAEEVLNKINGNTAEQTNS